MANIPLFLHRWTFLFICIIGLTVQVTFSFPILSPPGDNIIINDQADLTHPETIKIGLIITKEDALGNMAHQGAEIAIIEANEKGGYKGKPFELVVRNCEGPWGVTSKEVVNFIYEDEVWAIMGSLDGRNAHLAEQVTTKSHISLVETRATDPTLSQAFIPWFFRCIPDDRQQASVLFNAIYGEGEMKKIAVIATDDYDSKTASDSFLKISRSNNVTPPKLYTYDLLNDDYLQLFREIENTEFESIGLFCIPEYLKKFTQQISIQRKEYTVYCNLILQDTPAFQNIEKVITISPHSWHEDLGKSFKQKFRLQFKQQPGLVAGYSYDGMQIIIQAIKKSGLDREAIRDKLAETDFKGGVTGPIRFDEHGNRVGSPKIIEIKHGKEVVLKETAN